MHCAPAAARAILVFLATASLALAQTPFPLAEAGGGARRLLDYAFDGALTPPSSLDAEAVARRYLRERAGDGGVAYQLESRSTSFGGAVEHLTFTPRVAGIRYFGVSVRVHVDRQGRVVRFDAPETLRAPRDLAFPVDARRAAQAAAARSGARLRGALRQRWAGADAESRTEMEADGLARPIVASRAWFPGDGEATPAWTVYVEPDDAPPQLLVIDAATEQVRYQRSLIQQAEPDGYVFPAPHAQNPDAGAQALQFLSGRQDGGACPAPIYPSSFAASGLCWTDGVATVGNNADACADLDGDNVCDGRALGTNQRFLYPFTNAYDATLDSSADLSAALVNAFYWTNVAHDWLYGLGFDEVSGNFQQDNFGRGGYGGDAVRIDVHDGAATHNAWFSTPPESIAPRMQLGLWPGPRRDAAFDGDVILHEYVHGLTNRLVGGAWDSGALFIWQSGAMGEGWSDVMAASFTDDPVIGEYVTRNPSTGVRTVRYDQSSLTFGQFGRRRTAVLPGTTTLAGMPAVHRDGEIWASTLWSVREAIGRESFEEIVVAALKLTPRRPSMLDARDAVLQAAGLHGLSAPQLCQVWQAFASRGMGASAAVNPIGPTEWPDTAISVFEAFDTPASCGGSPPVFDTVLHSEGAESASTAWTADGLWHRTTAKAATGAWSWWFGQEATGDYNTGARASGSLTSPVISLAGQTGAVLEWKQTFRGEGFLRAIEVGSGLDPYLNLDSGRVWISIDGGSTWTVLTHIAHESAGSGFVQHRVNLSSYAGQSIRLRFEFDTFTAENNAHEGWRIDDIQVKASGGAAPVLEVGPQSLAFAAVSGQAAGAGALSISNGGGGSLEWTAAPDAAWLTVAPSSGSGVGTLQVTANAASLPPGDYAASIEVDAGAAGAISVPVSLSVQAANPVAAWSFEEPGAGAGVAVADATGGGRNGSTVGVGTAPAQGVAGGGRLFNGLSGSVAVAADAALTPDRMTVRVWVKPMSFPSSFGVVASQFGGANAKGWYLAVTSDGHVVLMGATPPSSTPWLVSGSVLQLGRWHHLTATIDRLSGQARIYIDGVLDRTATFPGVTADPASPLTFGKASWTDSYRFNAVLDEAAIYPAIWDASAVAQDFAAFSPPAPVANPAVAAEWSFDASLGDISGNGHDPAAGGGSAVAGVLGSARRLSGLADALEVPMSAELNPASFTLRAWVRLPQAPAAWGDLISNYGADFAGWRLGLTADAKPFFAVASRPSQLPSVVAPAPLEIGRWTELTAVYNGPQRRMALYVDGALAAERYGTDMTPRTQGLLTLGRASWIDAHAVACDLDEVLLEPRAWSAAEVSADFQSFPAQTGIGPQGPLAVWSFEETSVGAGATLADAVDGHDIVLSGTRHGPHSGLSGAARWFSGWPDVATVENAEDFENDSFTFSTWVRLQSYPASWGSLFGNYDGAWAGWYAGVYKDGRVILCAAGASSRPWLLSSAALTPGRWHHVAVTFDGPSRRGRVYVDGVLSASATFPSWQVSSGVTPTFGRATWAQTGWLAFSLDEARYDAVERSPNEIVSDYAELAGSLDPAPVADWRFDEAQGAAALADSTGRGHHATLADPGASALGGAWRFSGAGGATVAPHSELGASTFTFAARIKLDSLPSNWGVVYSSYAAGSRGWYLAVDSAGRLILCIAGQPGSAPWLVSAGSVVPGQWTDVAVTFDNVNRRGALYLDGVLDRTAVFPVFTPQSDSVSTFAQASWTTSYFLPVTLDRARLWRKEFTAQELQNLWAE